MIMTASVANVAAASNPGSLIAALVAAEGSGVHRYVTSHTLLAGKHATRNLADAIHFMCILHGRHPGVADHAANHTAQDNARTWLIDAVDGFIRERSYLTRLVVAAGPLPSTPGQAESETAVNGQRHALEMLAQSDRNGCALGATLALALDWQAVRDVFDAAAKRFGIDSPAINLPSPAVTGDLALSLSGSPALERAMSFGAQQILAQHRGLWDLLEARQLARGEY
jgi:hypothetical protein